jgi:uncharacterized protein (TIGR03437 family)
MRNSLPLILCGIAALPLHAQRTLNLSHDLVPLGIASQNLVPNTPALDAQPLFAATLQYIQNNPVQLLTADPGAYYFLTTFSANSAIYVYFPPLSNLTIDFQGSTLYFKDGFRRGFDIENCQGLTLKNFTIDYLTPSYTQVQLTAIDPVKRTFTYAVMPGWADPKTFTVTPEFGTPELLAVFFRNGALIPATGLIIMSYPISGNTLSAEPSDTPWSQSDVLGTLRPGDVVAISDDIGADPLDVVKCDSMLFTNIEIHGGIGAINLFDTSNSTLDHIRVVPRPGALLGSASGGLMFFDPLQNNHIRNSYVTRTLDDALGMGSDPPAVVMSQPGPRQLVVQRGGTDHLPNGTLLSFVPIGTAAELGGGIVMTQDPPDSPDDVVGQVQVTLTFDRDLLALSPGDQVFYASSDKRGSGSTIEDNVVEDIPYGRGVFIGGLENVVVQRNVIRGTSNSGIDVSEVSLVAGGGGAPSHGVTIQNNSVENVLGPQAAGSGGIGVSAAAIAVSSQDDNFEFVSQAVNSNVSILNNFVIGSGRTGIWIGELNGGGVSGNLIARWNQHPELLPEGGNPFPQDFAQPLVVRFSQNVNTSNNVIEAASSLTGAVNLSPSSVSPGAESSSGSIAVQVNLPNFSWAVSSDSLWLTITAGGSGTGNGTVQYAVAENTTGSPRSGTIAIAGVNFTVMQSAVKSPPAFTAAGVGSAASYVSGTVSPGEIVVIFGSNLGPDLLAGAALDNNGLVSKNIANTRVTFDGVAAPIVYVSANQSSVIVPYSVSGASTKMVVTYNGQSSAPVTLNVAPSLPGLFTANASGEGQGAFSNADSRPNSANNPAVKGSIITMYATGEGLTTPPSVDGKIAVPPYTVPVLPVSVTIDSIAAELEYKGGAPAEVAGVMQVNVKIPAAAHSGNVPVVLTVGTAKSQDSVTVAVQ